MICEEPPKFPDLESRDLRGSHQRNGFPCSLQLLNDGTKSPGKVKENGRGDAMMIPI
jgi:hypothetical protein